MKIAGADLGRMARRSGHCLPSDSDKFTIKLHSLPSKFLSFLSLLFADSATSSLLSRLFSRTSSRASLSRRGSFLSSAEKTRGGFFGGIVVYSLAITITHYTPAPSCPSFSLLSSLLSLRCPPASLFSSSYRFVVFSISFRLSSLLFLPPLSPFFLRLFCRVGHGYSAIVFDLSYSYCGCSKEFRVPSVTAYCIGISSLLFSLFRSSSLSPCCSPVGIYFFLVALSFPDFLLSFRSSLHFLLFLKWMLEFMKQN